MSRLCWCQPGKPSALIGAARGFSFLRKRLKQWDRKEASAALCASHCLSNRIEEGKPSRSVHPLVSLRAIFFPCALFPFLSQLLLDLFLGYRKQFGFGFITSWQVISNRHKEKRHPTALGVQISQNSLLPELKPQPFRWRLRSICCSDARCDQ